MKKTIWSRCKNKSFEGHVEKFWELCGKVWVSIFFSKLHSKFHIWICFEKNLAPSKFFHMALLIFPEPLAHLFGIISTPDKSQKKPLGHCGIIGNLYAQKPSLEREYWNEKNLCKKKDFSFLNIPWIIKDI
jgi:hypothetical protein